MSAAADLEAFVAFLAEHQRCGDLHTGNDNGFVWMDCSCSALIMRPVDPAYGTPHIRPLDHSV